jgi:ArsR family transcriptional regulator, arsenate/arsenite/antimonite-responsive transcriptional repressor / arsenate reductase (thioredoxin)
MANEETTRYADIFAALGSEHRLEIMRLLFAAHPGALTVGDLQTHVNIPNSTLSHHLEKLRVEGLVSAAITQSNHAPKPNETEPDVKSGPNHAHEDKFMFEAFLQSINQLFGSLFDRMGLPGFERFTEKAIQSIVLAQNESRYLNHAYVGTEQLLLGLMEEGTNVAAQVLVAAGLTAETVRTEVETIIGHGRGTPLTIPFTPRAKRVLELSLEQARQLGHRYIGTEHLLLGILREGEGLAAKVLEKLGLNLEALEQQVRQAAMAPE